MTQHLQTSFPREETPLSIKGTITEIKRFATHDGPGIRTTIFLKGCPLKCKWCSNPETQKKDTELYFIRRRCSNYGNCIEVCPTNAISMDKENKINREKCILCFECVKSCPSNAFQKVGWEITVEEAFKEIMKDYDFYGEEGGLTLSGGEPLYQPDFTISLLKMCHDSGISTVLDTSGFAPPNIVKEAVKYTTMVLLDLKHMDPYMHEIGTGISNTVILNNAPIFSKHTNVRISFPLIPGYNDSEENIKAMVKFTISLGIEYIDINPLHILGSDKYRALDLEVPYEEFRKPSKGEIDRAVSIIEEAGLKTTIGRML